MRNLLLLFALTICLSTAFAQQKKEPITVTDMLRLKVAGNLTAPRTGGKAVFTVMHIEPSDASKKDYKYVTQLYLTTGTAGSTPIQLTTAKEGASQPAWSPDGSRLAFVRSVENKPQVFILSASGGEAQQLTSYKYGASNPVWSPDGKQIVFSAGISLSDMFKDTSLKAGIPTWPFEKPGYNSNPGPSTAKSNPDGGLAEVRSYLESNAADKKAIVLNKLNFQDEMNISSEMNFGQLLIIQVDQPAAPSLITSGFYRFNNPSFTPDGKQLVFTGHIDSTQHPDRSLESEIFITDTNGKNLRVLAHEKGRSFGNATVSNSGKWIAFTMGKTDTIDVGQLVIMPLNGSMKDAVTIPYDREQLSLEWSDNDEHLYFTAQMNGGIVLHRVNMSTRNIEPLSSTDEGISSYCLMGDRIIYAKTKTTNPSEVYSADLQLKNEQMLSNLNEWVNSKQLSIPEKHSFTNEKGLTVEYWVMKPTNYQPGKKYPMLLEIHGGPSAMWGPGVLSMWHEYQFFCSKGYGVVYSNPRGSGGYGEKFLRGNYKDWGAGPSSDVLTSLDKAVAEGWADTSRLFITGGSYAGYLTAWIIAHDKRFRAACSQRGVYDLATFFGEGNAWRLVPFYFGGYPWEPETKKLLERESPITYVQNITTPYIIFHGANDRRTGFVQGEMMYRSLKVLNRPVEYVVHPGATHEITRSGDNRQRIDQMLRTWEFFERWMKY